jgi:FkbM family methyltransferase
MHQTIAVSPAVRRFTWRLGRRLYCAARGEPRENDIASNGEAYVQACVTRAVPLAATLRAVDIGANQGEWTLSLLRAIALERGAEGGFKIDLFEPTPTTAERLIQALSEAGAMPFTEIHKLAVSDRPGKVRLALMSATGGSNSLHFDHAAGAPPGGWIDVETDTLVNFCRLQALGHIHLAKCDAEGHDLAVLRGARELLCERRVDVFQFEYNHRWVFSRSFLKDVFELIDGLPYRVARIMPSHIEAFDGWHPELERYFEANYLIVRDDVLDWFDVREGRFDGSNTYT